MLSRVKKAAQNKIKEFIDDQITKQLEPYLVSGEYNDEVRSDVIVNENNDISIINLVVRPSAVDAMLAENEIPLHVITASCKRVHIDIPCARPPHGTRTDC